jgi:putative alpha-1,2-mannosidase
VIKSAVLKFENGKALTIKAENQGEKNVYVKRVTLNGRRLDRPHITHAELMVGGTLIFEMDNEPRR